VTEIKTPVHLLILLLILSACDSPATTSVPSSEQTIEETLAPYPDTPSPPKIEAPLVDSPSLVSIQFLNSLEGWGVTETQIVRTNDGGFSWHNVTPPNVTETGYNVDTFVLDTEHIWLQVPDFANYPNSGILYHTSDGGLTWTSSSSPISRGRLEFLDVNNGWALANLGIGAGSNAVAVYQTTDGGREWHQTFINDPNNANAGNSLPLGGLKFGIAPLDMVSAWVYGIVYSPGTVYLYRTENAGHLWEEVSISLPQGAENAELTIEQVKFVSPNDAFLVMRLTSETINLALYTSNDSGNSWTLTPTLIPDAGPANFLSADEAVIYNGNQFFVTRDGAHTWSIIPPDVNFGDKFLEMDFVSLSTGWVVTFDSTTNHRSLYRTGDGGATWFSVVQ
jgi:photosystem II stability/assembly factor-like uncharacterized protein